MENKKNKKGESLLKIYLSKKIKTIISNKKINKNEEGQGSKLAKESNILSKLSVSPLNIFNLNSKKEKEDTEEKEEKFEKKEKMDIKIKKNKKDKKEVEKPKLDNKIKQFKKKQTVSFGTNLALSGFTTLKGQLTNITELIIHQEPDISELFCGCQQPNNYHVYIPDLNGDLTYIYKLREFSGKCNRIFIPVNCRGFTMKAKLTHNKKNSSDTDYKKSLMKIEKDFKIPCLCLVRPEIVVEIIDEKRIIGKVVQSFSLCDPVFTVYNEEDEEIKYIEADCCQCGFVFRNWSIGKTEECQFKIYNSRENTNPIGYIVKKTESIYSLGDSYFINFPAKLSCEEKFLLSMVAILIDYQYYEKNNEVIK